MKKTIYSLVLLLLAACQNSGGQQKVQQVKPTGQQKIAVFAGGCFWGLQEGFLELRGVSSSISGYAGGHTQNPTYEEVMNHSTGHAEAVQVVYDPKIISFSQLLDAFFIMHDGTQLNRQGADIGTNYRSVAFYSTPEEKKEIEKSIAKQNTLQLHPGLLVTEVIKLDQFYTAEQYHQNYVKLNPNNPYVQNVCGPKVEKLRRALPHLLKNEYKP